MSAPRPPEPFLRPDADANPSLCRVDGCDREPWSRGVCRRHYNQLDPSGSWRAKAAEILAPSKVASSVVPKPAATVEEKLRAEIQALADERQALTTERAALLLRAEGAEQELAAARAHADAIDSIVLNVAGVPLTVEGPEDRVDRVRWLAARVRLLESRAEGAERDLLIAQAQAEEAQGAANDLRRHLTEIDVLLTEAGAPLGLEFGANDSRRQRIRWLTRRGRTPEARPAAQLTRAQILEAADAIRALNAAENAAESARSRLTALGVEVANG